MIGFFQYVWDAFDQSQRDLVEQGYMVVFGGATCFVVPIRPTGGEKRPPRRRGILPWVPAPAALVMC
jgi:hypothetical protein